MEKSSFSAINKGVDSYWIRACIGLNLIILLIIFLSCIYLQEPKGNGSNENIEKLNYSYRSFLGPPDLEMNQTQSGCIHRDCSFICGNSSKLNEDLTKEVEKIQCPKIDSLEIQRQNFPTISKYWLLINSSISELIVKNSNLISIENEAFNSDSFTDTIVLSIENSKLQNLTAGMLLGFTKVEYVTIISEIININRIFFQPIRSTLHFLKMSQMTESIRFDQIFGISNMTHLRHLDLSNNKFYVITGNIFKFIPQIRFLSLANSKIKVIVAGAFDNAKSLKILDLSNNDLKQIYDMKIVLFQTYLYLRDNPWNCSCDLEPLIKLYKMRNEMFMDISYCKYPQNYYGQIISKVPYDCQTSSGYYPQTTHRTTKISITDVPVTATSLGDDRELSTFISDEEINKSSVILKQVKLTCLNFFENHSQPMNNNSNTLSSKLFQELTILPPIYAFNITLISENSILLEISNDVEINDLEFIWYISEKSNIEDFHYECTNINKNKTAIIKDLKENSSYVFCIVPTDQDLISPFNCLPFYIPADNTTQSQIKLEEIWLTKDDKEATIAIVCLILSISLGFGGILTYLVLKRYPNLLEGNKHVIVVKKSIDRNFSEKQLSISTVSSKNNPSDLSANSMTSFKHLRTVNSTDGAYEQPLEIDEGDSYTMDHLDYLRKQFEKEKNLNSFQKRHSEHIYGTIKSPVARHTKRSI